MKEPKKNGRPTMKSPQLLEEFCRRVASGRSVANVCAEDDMPADKTIWQWLSQDKSFADDYARAVQARAVHHADGILDLEQKLLSGEIPPDVARVAIDTRKWVASRLLPKIYGDKQTVDVSVTHTHQLHLDALKRLNDTARAIPHHDVIDGEVVSVSE